MGGLKDIMTGCTAGDYILDPKQGLFGIEETSLGPEQAFSGKGDSVSVLGKVPTNVFSNIKHPESDLEKVVSEINDLGSSTILLGSDRSLEYLRHTLKIERFGWPTWLFGTGNDLPS